ncbi:thioredoxin [Peribacillus muralis]|uniref:Thioredoxin n=1 Tax=Peribacillus muralis TaxID=264697 RepID=A0A1B3XJB9_9BACI|nr:thioredoxin family protein [Peribacillus muralis]AOH53315.1 thioredoxin [Peribacillus muralis]
MTTLNEWFGKGIPAEEFISSMKVHKESLQSIQEHFSISVEDGDFFDELKAKELRAIVITEDWCGDAMMNIPILLNIAEAANIETRMILRDENLDLMDQYLTNGTARSIPIFIFIDKHGEERAVWGPRAPKVQDYVMELRSVLPAKEDERFEAEQKEVFKKITKAFSEDGSLWSEVYGSIKETLGKID